MATAQPRLSLGSCLNTALAAEAPTRSGLRHCPHARRNLLPLLQVCSGRTGHTEAVQLTYRPAEVTFDQLCDAFFAKIDPTQVRVPLRCPSSPQLPRCTCSSSPNSPVLPSCRGAAREET